MNVAVADTHALIWLHSDSRKLGSAARRAFAEAERSQFLVYVPSLVLVEISEAIRGGRLHLQESFDDWLNGLFRNSCYQPVDLTEAMARRSHALYAIPERGDRLLAATALELDCPLITSDTQIAASGLVATLW